MYTCISLILLSDKLFWTLRALSTLAWVWKRIHEQLIKEVQHVAAAFSVCCFAVGRIESRFVLANACRFPLALRVMAWKTQQIRRQQRLPWLWLCCTIIRMFFLVSPYPVAMATWKWAKCANVCALVEQQQQHSIIHKHEPLAKSWIRGNSSVA